ncbi:hypothetical protein [Gellertiella hungarica]|uniref:DUF2946 domain-containing protein n=2 Tax=Gellertiella hungarica TaxID=1572859 RepID=A0A7W6JB84_9HYPH|nr:hypothetical protein [Gellertiella hungarica]MBB4067262.1 hypothetical protein [Gellertiella hungarica]
MKSVFRIRSTLLTLFFRLVIVMSLAGYSTYAVETVMHSNFGSETATVEAAGNHGGHDTAMTTSPADDGHDHDHSAPEKTKPSCCVDYCGVAALTCAGAAIAHPRSELVLVALDDRDFMGRLPQLHRPPSI